MKSVIYLLEEQVKNNKDRLAMVNGDISLTYTELWELIIDAASIFSQKGIKSGMGVSVCIELSKEKIIAMLAILYIGAKFIVFEKGKLSQQQRNNLLQESECQYCIQVEQTNTNCIKYVVSNVFGTEGMKNKEEKIEDDVIYYISTSGSTGKPKLVAKKNVDIVSRIINIKYNTNISFGGSGLQFCSFHFAFAYIEMFSQLILGNTIFCYPAEERTNVQFLHNMLCENEIDTVFMPTVIFELLAKSDVFLMDFPNALKQIVVAGGKLSVNAKIAKVLIEHDVKLFNDYGCAEVNSICIHQCSLRYDDLLNVPAGDRNMFVDIKVVGDSDQEGCLYVRNIFDEIDKSTEDLQNYHNTGDVCRITQDGKIVIIGRNDNQIKINGCRIDIDDIQHYVMKLDEVKECCVLLVPSERQEKKMFAFVTTYVSVSEETILCRLKEIMPEYMIPSFIEIVTRIDMLPSGKFDKVRMRQKAIQLMSDRKKKLSNMSEGCIIEILRKMTGTMDNKEKLLEMRLGECGLDSMTFVLFLVQVEKKYGTKFDSNKMEALRKYTVKQFLAYVNRNDKSRRR